MHAQIISKPVTSMTGTARYTMELYCGLRAHGVDVTLTSPQPFTLPVINPILQHFGIDSSAFFNSYPLFVAHTDANIVHIPTQTMATLLWLNPMRQPVVVTVLDIIPFLVRHDPLLRTFRHIVDERFYHAALAALRRADAIIAISDYTRRTLIETLGIPPERIHVVYLGVDQQRFVPLEVPEDFRLRTGLREDRRYILYVGSEDPRKNLKSLLRAFAQVHRSLPDVELIKVGAAHFDAQHAELLSLARVLGVEDAIHFFEHVTDEELPHFYNASSMLAMLSYYEGFGFPVIEAMACGIPVVISNRTSLPELAGGLASLVDPDDIDGIASALIEVLSCPTHPASEWREQASKFTWQSTIQQTLEVYQQLGR
jgi:glycosyltransferase involved in cell wall biosynthesis